MQGSALRTPDIGAESDRLAALDRFDVLDTAREEAFDRIARLIKLTLEVDIGLVTLMDAHRQWYKAAEGMPRGEGPLDQTFCQIMLSDGRPLIVPDTALDARFIDHPHVGRGANVRFYAGAPLKTREGHTIGSVCAVDAHPREFSGRDEAILVELAEIAMDALELRQLATIDGLTGALSRRAFKEDAQKFVALSRRHQGALSAISFDIDHFKDVNDTYGHAAGDQVLVSAVRSIGEQLRKSDLFGRLGGEEFAVLLPHTDQGRAMEVAEKLRLIVRSLRFPGSHPPIAISSSFGVATLDTVTDDLDSLLRKSDEALYDAKRSGRNKCLPWRPESRVTQLDRRRVLKAGKILLDNQSLIDCTVRSLGEEGATLAVNSTFGIPEQFTLQIKADARQWPCVVTGRTEQQLTVDFE